MFMRLFFFNDTATTEIYTLSLHDALPISGEIARAFFDRMVAQARERGLLSDEHFTVDGTLVEAWASLKSFKRNDETPAPPDDPGYPTVNFQDRKSVV